MSALSAAQLDHFATEGYLVVQDLLDPALDIQPVFDEYEGVLDGIATSFFAEGIIASSYADLPFRERLIQVCQESGRSLSQYFDLSLPLGGIHRDTPIHTGPAVFALLTSPRLLAAVEDIVGPEIYSNPVQHIRMKLPARARTSASSDGLNSKIPWHQDNGVVLPEADVATILTVWMPLNDATLENGCLQVIPRSHRGELEPHCPGPAGLEIPERFLPQAQAVPLPMRAGSVLLMTQRTVHSSLDNVTPDQVRISLDLRYQPVGQPTGRPVFPGFVARSAAQPESVLTDPEAWAAMWLDTREKLAEEDLAFNRWKAGVGACA
jgi:ectoine hydroxylase-related dioxygenase (phytanoyl-CoA dioxygenase family)